MLLSGVGRTAIRSDATRVNRISKWVSIGGLRQNCRNATTASNRIKSCHHKCIKKLFGFSRSDSMPGILMQLSLPSFDTIIRGPIYNSRVLFKSHCSLS